MNRITIAAFAGLLLASSCSLETTPEEASTTNAGTANQAKIITNREAKPKLEPLVNGSWQGELPCADCEAIAYKLSLLAGNTFESAMVYEGKSVAPHLEKGTWFIDADSVVQLISSSSQTQFKFSGKSLIMLDNQGRPIRSSTAENYRLHRSAENPAAAAVTMLEAKRRQGIDFVASGSSWNLEIDLENNVRFQSPQEKLSLTAPTPTEQKLPNGNGMVYRAKTEAGTLTVRVINQPCTEKTTGRELPYQVEVTANAQSYNGCGQFLQDSRLTGNWKLQEMNGSALKATDFPKGLPELEIQLDKKSISGNSGCNNLRGNLEVKGDKISFSNLISTKMACAGPPMTFETAYLKMLSAMSYTYLIEADQLIIKDKGQNLLVYKK